MVECQKKKSQWWHNYCEESVFSTKCFPLIVLRYSECDSFIGLPANMHYSKLSITEYCFWNDSKMVIFGISQGVVMQLNVSNSFTNGTKNITMEAIEITHAIVITIFLITKIALNSRANIVYG